MAGLTITEMKKIMSKHGITPGYAQAKEGENTVTSKVIFIKDTQKARDLAIIEQTIQDIMERRGVSREEAERILNNPF